jgi:hypothetical protein
MKSKSTDLLLLRFKLYVCCILRNINEISHVRGIKYYSYQQPSVQKKIHLLLNFLNLFIKQIDDDELEKNTVFSY